MLVQTFLFDTLLVDSKMTTLHEVPAACGDVHHISMEASSHFIPLLFTLDILGASLAIKWHAVVSIILGDPARLNF
jgi:hypothetical protein